LPGTIDAIDELVQLAQLSDPSAAVVGNDILDTARRLVLELPADNLTVVGETLRRCDRLRGDFANVHMEPAREQGKQDEQEENCLSDAEGGNGPIPDWRWSAAMKDHATILTAV
jgi:hypothetical protein